MNKQGNDLVRILCLAVLFPVLLCLLVLLNGMERAAPIPDMDQQTVPSTDATVPAEVWMLSVLYQGESRQIDLETYILGVVLAEMPSSFHLEALKAQAIATRTYTLKHCPEQKPHGENVICSESTCCQAYIDPEDYICNGGNWESVEKVRYAVSSTAAMALVYNDKLIDATYFSCSGGITEDAVQVWGQNVPYLQSVPSPGEEDAPVYEDSKSFTAEEFQKILGVVLYEPVECWFGNVVHTESGSVQTMCIGGVDYRGTTLRQLLGLRSTIFSVSVSKEEILFHTRGFGHRVGMSQYGANAMAVEGKTCAEILMHYYTGAVIVQFVA